MLCIVNIISFWLIDRVNKPHVHPSAQGTFGAYLPIHYTATGLEFDKIKQSRNHSILTCYQKYHNFLKEFFMSLFLTIILPSYFSAHCSVKFKLVARIGVATLKPYVCNCIPTHHQPFNRSFFTLNSHKWQHFSEQSQQ